MKHTTFEHYDRFKLLDAKKLLVEVYEYYYDYPPMRKQESRLETIINKLDALLYPDGKEE